MKKIVHYLPLLLLLGACGKVAPTSNSSTNGGLAGQESKTEPQTQAEIKLISRSFQFRAVNEENEKCSKLAFWNDVTLDGQYDPELDQDRVEHRFCGEENKPQNSSVKAGTIALATDKNTQLGYLLSKTDIKVCAYGGFKLELWIDKNKDGVFQKDSDSAVVEFTTCNGKDGSTPFTTSEKVAKHPACPAAATLIKSFIDVDRNQKYDANVDTNYQEQAICDGKNGTSSAFQLEEIAKEPSCGAKAVRLSTWTDVNGNGTYEEGIDSNLQSKVICHGKDFQSDFIGTFTRENHALSLDLNRYAWHEWRNERAPSATYGELMHFETTASKLMTFQPEYFECRNDGGKGVEAIARADFFKWIDEAAKKKIVPLEAKQTEVKGRLAQAEVDKVTSEAKHKAATLELETVKKAVHQLQEKIARQEIQLTGLNDSVTEKKASLAELNQRLEKTTNELKLATQTESKWIASVNELSLKVKALTSELARVENSLKLERKVLSQIRAQLADRQLKITNSDAEIRVLTQKVEAIKKETGWDWFGNRKHRLEKAKEALTLALGKRNNYVVELNNLKVEEKNSEARVSEWETKSNEVAKKLAMESQSLTEAQAQNQAASSAKQKLAMIVNELTARQAKESEFLSGLQSTAQSVAQSLATNRSELKQALQQQSATESLIAGLVEKLARLVAAMEKYRAELSHVAITIERLSKAATVATARQVYFYHFDNVGALVLNPSEGGKKPLLLGKSEKPQIPDTDLLCSAYIEELTQ